MKSTFTLLELMVVLLIVSILAMVATTYTIRYNKRIANETFCTNVLMLQMAIDNFTRNNKYKPSTTEVNNVIIPNNFRNGLRNPYTTTTITVTTSTKVDVTPLGLVMYSPTTGKLSTTPDCRLTQ